MKLKHMVRRDKTAHMLKAAAALAGRKAVVGVGGEMGRIARIHEFGARVPVTPKMRGFLGARFGVHLKADTRVLVIPERSFLRAGFDACHHTVLRAARPGLAQALGGVLNPNAALERHGRMLAQGVRAYAQGLQSPPNAPMTVAAKGKNDPLTDTGAMLAAIGFEVK